MYNALIPNKWYLFHLILVYFHGTGHPAFVASAYRMIQRELTNYIVSREEFKELAVC